MKSRMIRLIGATLTFAAGSSTLMLLANPAYGGTASGPSFDCSKASTSQEKLVCNDPELSKLDVAMMQAFRTARDSAPDRQTVIEQQRAWLKNAFRTCADKVCLAAAYRGRIAGLNNNRSIAPSHYTLAMKCAAASSFRGGVMTARGEAGASTYLMTARVMGYAAAIAGRKAGMSFDAAITENKATTDAYRSDFEKAAKGGKTSIGSFMTRHDAIENECAAKMKAPGNFKSLTDLAFRVNANQIALDQAAILFRPM